MCLRRPKLPTLESWYSTSLSTENDHAQTTKIKADLLQAHMIERKAAGRLQAFLFPWLHRDSRELSTNMAGLCQTQQDFQLQPTRTPMNNKVGFVYSYLTDAAYFSEPWTAFRAFCVKEPLDSGKLSFQKNKTKHHQAKLISLCITWEGLFWEEGRRPNASFPLLYPTALTSQKPERCRSVALVLLLIF